MTPACAK